MIVRPWRLGDSEAISLQTAQQYLLDNPENLSIDLTPLSEVGLAWTAELDGTILGCGGLTPQWENRAILWALVSQDAGSHFTVIHRHVRRFLTRSPYRRIEAHVDVGFTAGVRWVKMLGFELEAYKKAFRPDGADMLEFVRIRSWPI